MADKSTAVAMLGRAIDGSGVQRKVLAAECGWSEPQFSKVANGTQGDLLDLVYRLPEHRAGIRAEFFAQLADHEELDPVSVVVEQLAVCAMRFLRLRGEMGGARMAKAGLTSRRKSEVA